MDLCGYLWIYVDNWKIRVDLCGYLWIFVDICGYIIQSYLHAGRPYVAHLMMSPMNDYFFFIACMVVHAQCFEHYKDILRYFSIFIYIFPVYVYALCIGCVIRGHDAYGKWVL